MAGRELALESWGVREPALADPKPYLGSRVKLDKIVKVAGEPSPKV